MKAFMMVFAVVWALWGGGFILLATEVQITTVEDLIAAAAGGMIRSGPDAGLIIAPGDTLVLEPGKYSLTETVKVELPDLTIRAGGGRATTQIDAGRVRIAIEIRADGVTIGGMREEDGLVIRGAKGPGVVICAEQAAEDVTIQNNLIIGNSAEGILIHACQPAAYLAMANIRILDNEVRANRGDGIALRAGSISDQPDFEIFVEDNTIDGQLGAGILLDATNAFLNGNRIVRNRIGVLAKRAEVNRLRGNAIAGNLSFGVDATPLDQELDATGNFWGDASGPFHPQKNPLGKGDRVSDGVKFDPWVGRRPEDRIIKFQLTALFIPEQARVNHEIELLATIKNVGNAEGSTKVAFGVQGEQVEQVPIHLAPQAAQEIVFKYTFSSTGEFVVRITAGETTSPDDSVTKFIKVTPPQEISIATELELVQAAAGDRRDVAPGDTLILAPKTYRLSKPVIVRLKDLTIRSRSKVAILDGSGVGSQPMLILQKDNVTIEELWLINAPAEAIAIQGGQDIKIQRMIITGSDVGILLNTTGVMILENEISKNRIGIKAHQAGDNAIHRNRFINNREYGIDARGLPAGEELDATENFWGHVRGPRHPSNPMGRGDRVTDRVRFIPFLRDGEEAPAFEVTLVPNLIADRAEFIVRGRGLLGFRVEIFNLAGRKVFEAEEDSPRLRFLAVDQRGKKLANGLYLYVVTLKGAKNTLVRIAPRKLLILR